MDDFLQKGALVIYVGLLAATLGTGKKNLEGLVC